MNKIAAWRWIAEHDRTILDAFDQLWNQERARLSRSVWIEDSQRRDRHRQVAGVVRAELLGHQFGTHVRIRGIRGMLFINGQALRNAVNVGASQNEPRAIELCKFQEIEGDEKMVSIEQVRCIPGLRRRKAQAVKKPSQAKNAAVKPKADHANKKAEVLAMLKRRLLAQRNALG